jgi:signal transduction histidine kinase
VPLGEVLHQLAALARAAFADKKLTLSVDVDVPVGRELPQALGDETLCRSLFQNLIKNACEAAPPGSTVTVTLKDENPLRVVIQNPGVVPEAVRGRFFDKFATAGKVGGSGLGTYSARMLATAMRGRIAMDTSDADQTTTLTVWLPRYQDKPAEAQRPDVVLPG